MDIKDIVAFVTDSAAYCKKDHKKVLSNVFINSYYVFCLTHILNLIGEIFSHWSAFNNVTHLITFIKSAFFKKSLSKKRNFNGLKVPCLRNKLNYSLCQWQPDGIPGLVQPNIPYSFINSMKDSLSKKRAMMALQLIRF